MSTDVGTWLAAIVSLGALSFLYRENKFYNLVESIFVGLGAGYALVMGWTNIVSKSLRPIAAGTFAAIIPTVLGLMLFAKMAPKMSWVARYPTAVIVGMGSGVALRGSVDAELVGQIVASNIPLNNLSNVLLILGTIAVLVYFLFTLRPKENGAGGRVYSLAMTFARYTMMVAFGASFGNNAQQRVSQLIERLQFLFGTWIHFLR